MDKRTPHTIPKESPSGSLGLNHSILDGQSNWSRCNSFSSSSNDSSLFSSSHLQSPPKTLGKRKPCETPSAVISKRCRNSSGSSVSSNMSCVSDKDAKKTVILSNCVPQVSAHQTGIRTVDDISRLSCPDISSSAFGINHEDLLKQHLACTESPESILPLRHNLRRNIRKKTCSCDCTATCTTLVVRRYNKIGEQTVKEETLISTKVETCSTTKSSQEVHNVSYEKEFSPSKPENNRRRRSEVEKLYDSLHEIEWAKNFSPDNILRQINVRQAASVSRFANTSKPNQTSPESKASKKPKASISELSSKSNLESQEEDNKAMSPDNILRQINVLEAASVSMFDNRSKPNQTSPETKANKEPKASISELSSKSNLVESQEEDNKPMLDHIVNRTRSKTQNHEQQYQPSNSKTLADHKQKRVQKKGKLKTKCNQSLKPVADSKPSITGSSSSINSLTPKEVKLYPTDCESVSKLENSVVCVKTEPEDDLTTDIKFFDIAEESIRTIDACFREVGAEVVISTCYEGDSDLPQLTPVKDGSASVKQSSPCDIPPVLECCVPEEECASTSECNNCQSTNQSVCNESLSGESFAPDNDENTYLDTSSENMSVEKSFESDSDVNSQLTVSFESVCEEQPSAQDSDVSTVQTLSTEGVLLEKSSESESDVNSHLTESFESVCEEQPSAQDSDVSTVQTISTEGVSEEESWTREGNVNNNVIVNNESTCKVKSCLQETEKLKNSSLRITDTMKHPLKHSQDAHLNSKSVNRKLLIRAGKRILKKYLKYLQPKRNAVRETLIKVRRKPETSREDSVSSCLNLSISLSKHSLKQQGKMKNDNSLVSLRPSFTYNSHALSCETVGSRTVKKTEQKVSYSSSTSGVSFSHCQSDSLYASKETKSSFSSTTQNGKQMYFMKESSSSFSIHEPGPSTLLSIRHNYEDDKNKKSNPRPQNLNFTCHYQSLRVYRYNGYSQVVLKLTRRNSIFLGVESLAELKDVMKKIGQDPHCHTLILMGCGKSFCSGLDLLPLLGPQKNSASGEMAVAVKEFIEVLSAFKKPVVVVVDGPAIGLGVTILTHADISIASEMATFCMPQNSLGFFPEGGATLTLPKAVGSTVAMDLILRGRSLTATEAKQVGLISEVVSVKDLGLDLVSRIKRLAENSLTSMETTKAMLKMRLQLELSMVLESEVKLLPQMWLSESCQEALQSAFRSGIWIT